MKQKHIKAGSTPIHNVLSTSLLRPLSCLIPPSFCPFLPSSPCLPSSLAGHPVFLVAATLRPETMYGQTNCWLHPDINYIAFRVKTGEVFISTTRAALNMAYQDFTSEFGKTQVLLRLKGEVYRARISGLWIEQGFEYSGTPLYHTPEMRMQPSKFFPQEERMG